MRRQGREKGIPDAADGDLMLCGNNDTAQLGWDPQAQSIPEHLRGLTVEGEAGVSVTVPARVASLEAFSVHHVAVGLTHVCAVVGDGMLTTWGGNDSGQLGGVLKFIGDCYPSGGSTKRTPSPGEGCGAPTCSDA